jgi:hypothetical protein
VGNERIEDTPDILNGNIVKQDNLTRARIDCDVSGMRPVTERLCSRVFEMSRHIDDFASLGRKPSKHWQGSVGFSVASPKATIAELEGGIRLPKIIDCGRAQALQKGKCGDLNRVSGHYG